MLTSSTDGAGTSTTMPVDPQQTPLSEIAVIKHNRIVYQWDTGLQTWVAKLRSTRVPCIDP